MADNIVLTFEVYRGDALIKTAELKEESITIGSGSTALLSVDDNSLAELHAVLNVEEDGTVQLLDLGSEVGTRINGQAISNAKVTSGMSLEMGNVRIVVNITDDEAFEDEEATYVVPSPAEVNQAREAVLVHGAGHEPEAADPVTEEPPAPAEELIEQPVEDVMAFIMRSGTAQSNLGVDKERAKVLEINQLWGDVLVDTKHFRSEVGPKRWLGGHEAPRPVTIGSKVGYKWHFLGVDMGWVPSALAVVIPFVSPMWSEAVSDWKNDFYTGEQGFNGAKDHELFRYENGKYIAEINTDWDGFADVGDKRYSFEELVAAGKATKQGNGYLVPIEGDTRLMVDVNGVVFFSHMVHAPKRVLSTLFDNVDFVFMAILILAAFIGLMFAVAIAALPSNPTGNVVEMEEIVANLMQQEEKKKKEKDKKPAANPDAGEGAKAKLEEGKVGKKEAKLKKAKGNKREMDKSKIDRQVAENAGIMGALRNQGALDGLGGPSADMLGGVGGLLGAKGTQIGSGGLGSRGSGLGGGGSAEGLGGLGTRGMGSGASGYGSGGGNFGARGEGGIGRPGGDPIILGALDRALIDEVIKRHMNQIRYCYQRQLNKDPSLAGKVVIKFVIAKDGTVSSAKTKTTTMNNAAVQTCIEGRFMVFKFPEPKGGGIVIVSYPFLFSPG